MSNRARKQSRVGVATLLALVVVAGACGSRSSRDDLAALLNERTAQDASTVRGPETSEAVPEAQSVEGAAPVDPNVSGMDATGSAATAGTSFGGAVSEASKRSKPATGNAARNSAEEPRTPTPQGAASPTPASPDAGAKPASDGATGPGPAVPTPAAPGACTGSEPPLIIGSVGSMSGLTAYQYSGGTMAIKSWVAEVNSQGGVNCHKVKYIQGDDGGDPARNQAVTRRFVEKEGVIAFVFNPAPFQGQASADYLNEKQVPVMGQEGGQLFFYDSPMHFPVYAIGDMMQSNQIFQASRVWIPQGKKKVASLSCVEAEYCNLFDKTVADLAPKLGFDLAFQAKVTLTAPDYTSNCVEAKNQGVQAIITSVDWQTSHRLAASCARVGNKIPMAVASLQGSSGFADDPNMEGYIIGQNTRTWFDTGHPAIATYLQVLKRHAKGPDAVPGPSSINGWVSAKVFERAAKGIDPKAKPTSQHILDGLYALNGDDIDGLTYPLRFAPGQPDKKIACGFPAVAIAGKWTTPTRDLTCLPGFKP